MGFGADAAHVAADGGFGYFELHGHLGGGEASAHQAQDSFFAGSELVGAAKEAEHQGFAHTSAGEHEGKAQGRWLVCSACVGLIAEEGLLTVQGHYGHRGARQGTQGDHAALALGGFGQGVGQLAGIGLMAGGDGAALYRNAVAARQYGVGGQVLMQYAALCIDDHDAAGQLVQGAGDQLISGWAACGTRAARAFSAYVAALGAGQMAWAVGRGAGWVWVVCHGVLASSDEMPIA